jgi:hypothetical protein
VKEKQHAVEAFKALMRFYGGYYRKLRPDGKPERGDTESGLFDYVCAPDKRSLVPVELEADELALPYDRLTDRQRLWYTRQSTSGLRNARFWFFFMLGFVSNNSRSDEYPCRTWMIEISSWLEIEQVDLGKSKSLSYDRAVNLLAQWELIHVGRNVVEGWQFPLTHPFAVEYGLRDAAADAREIQAMCEQKSTFLPLFSPQA